jgi:magnesium transporter
VTSHLITVDRQPHESTPEEVRRLLASSTRFWMDLSEPSDGEVQDLLGDTLRLHPLAVQATEEFGQRPKIDAYDDFTLFILYAATPSAKLVEIHAYYSANFVVTVHREPCPALDDLVEALSEHGTPLLDHVMVLYRVIDAVLDGYFPVMGNLDDQIDQLEDEILERPTEEQLGRLFDMKRSLIAMRKVVTPQRDMFASLLTDPDELPGMNADAERYFRDLYDHLIRISDLVDSYRDLIGGALDTHLATVSNRLNVVMKQLTIIATVFLPLSFLTGFFGQNFSWLVTRITGFPLFLGVGIGLEVLAVAALVIMFRRRGWLSTDGTVPAATPARRPSLPRAIRWESLHPARTTVPRSPT